MVFVCQVNASAPPEIKKEEIKKNYMQLTPKQGEAILKRLDIAKNDTIKNTDIPPATINKIFEELAKKLKSEIGTEPAAKNGRNAFMSDTEHKHRD